MLFNNLKYCLTGIALMVSACCAWAVPYLYDSVCPNGPDGSTPGGSVYGGYWHTEKKYYVDKWGFAQCNCTSYAANRVNMNSITFNNSSFGQHWGHGGHWATAAQAADIPVDASPTAGSVAQWNSDEIGDPDTSVGHVAYVEHVFRNTDGSVQSIVISEYNVTPNSYTNPPPTVKPGDSHYPPRFIHFEQLRVNGNIGWFPPVDSCHAASQWFLILRGTDNEAYKAGSSSISACPTMCVPN